jgi:hypothetical protein
MADSPIKQSTTSVPPVTGILPFTPATLGTASLGTASTGAAPMTGFFDQHQQIGLIPNPCSGGSDCGCGGNCGSTSSAQSVANAQSLPPGSLTVAKLSAILASAPQSVKNQLLGSLTNSVGNKLVKLLPGPTPIQIDSILPDPTGDSPCDWVFISTNNVSNPSGSGSDGFWSIQGPCADYFGGGGSGAPAGLLGGGGGPQKGTGAYGSSGFLNPIGTPTGGPNALQQIITAAKDAANLANQIWTANSPEGKAIQYFLDKFTTNDSNEPASTLDNILTVLNGILSINALSGFAKVSFEEGVAQLLEALSAGEITFEAVVAILAMCSTPDGFVTLVAIIGAIVLAVNAINYAKTYLLPWMQAAANAAAAAAVATMNSLINNLKTSASNLDA